VAHLAVVAWDRKFLYNYQATVEGFRRSLTLTLSSDFLVYFPGKVEMQQAIDMFEA